MCVCVCVLVSLPKSVSLLQTHASQGPDVVEELVVEGEEEEEGGDWDAWMDQFVVAATAAPPAPEPYSATRALSQQQHGEHHALDVHCCYRSGQH